MSDRTPEQQALADLLLSFGVRLPLRAAGMLGREIRQDDGHPLLFVMPSDSLSDDRGRALAIAHAVNAATGTPDREAEPLPVLLLEAPRPAAE